MVKKVTKTGKVTKPVKKVSTKPKGKVVKASVADLTDDLSEEVAVSAAGASQTLVSQELITKALDELKGFIEREQSTETEKAQLFEDDVVTEIQLQFTKSSLWTSKKDFKPRVIPLGQAKEVKPTVALIVRDGLIDKDLLAKIEASEINNVVGQIITGAELKTTYKQFEKRRQLWAQYDLFLCDDALVTTLPKLLGKTFYDSRKLPVPIRVGKDGFSVAKVLKEVNRVSEGVVYRVPRSDNLVVALGKLEQVTAGLVSGVIAHFSKDALRGVFIKSNSSPALPLYEAEQAFTEAVDEGESIEKAVVNTVEIEGEQVKLSAFERALVELAPDAEVPKLLAGKIKKAKKAKKAAEKNESKVTKPAKVAKKAVKAKK